MKQTLSREAHPAYNLNEVRAQFEVTQRGLAYLNHAGMSPLPIPVKGAMNDAIERIVQDGSLVYGQFMEPLLDDLLTQAGLLVNAAPDEITFVGNTSTGINLVAQSLPFSVGDNVLLCDVEFPSNVYPWQNLIHKGVETRLIPATDGGLSIETLDAARDKHTRLVAVSGVQFFTGRRENLTQIGEYCEAHGLWLVVDAIQAAGIIPIDMQAMGIHALASGGQKALMAPPGQGFLAIRSELIEQMTPVFVGAVSVADYEHWLAYDMTPAPGARRFDMGTVNIPGLAGLRAAITFLLGLGIKHIAEWVTHLSDLAIADLSARGYRVITPADPASHANIVTFAWEGNPEQAVSALQDKGIIIRPHKDKAGNDYLRLSTHCYNTEEEVVRVGEVLRKVKNE